MKTTIVTLAISLMVVASLSAQEFHLGIKGGVNFASIGGDETDDIDRRTAFHAGLVSEIKFTEKFAVQPELLYSALGYKTEFSETINGVQLSEEESVDLDYLTIPLMAKYYLMDNLAIEAGPQIGLLLSADRESEERVNGGNINSSEKSEEDIKDSVNGTDIGFAAGLSFNTGTGAFISARYVLGVSNINDFSESENSVDISNQNNVIQLSIGYLFN